MSNCLTTDNQTLKDRRSPPKTMHAAPWEQRLTLAEALSDPRLKIISMQLIHTERPELLPDAIRADHDLRRARRLLGLDETVPWLILPRALADIESMLMDARSGIECFLRSTMLI